MAEPKIVKNGIALGVQGDIGGVNVMMECAAGEDTDLDTALDRMTKAYWRQQAKVMLINELVELKAREITIAKMPQTIADYRKQRTDERIRLAASFEAAYSVSNKRAPYQRTPAQQQKLLEHDQKTEEQILKYEHQKEQAEAEIPMFESRVARQRAIIAGRERWEVIEADPLEAAAE